LVGLSWPRRIAAAQREPSWTVLIPSGATITGVKQRAQHRRAVEPYSSQDHR
jgi:hypothetical protein